MAFDANGIITPLCSDNEEDSIFVWSSESMDEWNNCDGKMQTLQLMPSRTCGNFVTIYSWPTVRIFRQVQDSNHLTLGSIIRGEN